MYANPRKTRSIRQLGSVDIAALHARVIGLGEDEWDRENAGKPNRFEALDRTRHIVFRFVDGLKDWRSSHDRPAWAGWRELIEPVLTQAVAPYGYASGDFPRVMLARMPAGGVIQPHRDGNPAAKWPHKIHVPIVTNDAVTFFIEGKGYHLPQGEAAEVNNMDVHAVENLGDTDRIHLIFEYYDRDQAAPDWVRAA